MSAESYDIDAAGSRFTVRAFATGFLAALGHSPTFQIEDFHGEASFSPESADAAKLSLKINPKSLHVTDKINAKDRTQIERTVNQQVLETDRYPEIRFESSRVSASRAGQCRYVVNLVGMLSLHGTQHAEPVAVQVAVEGDTLRAQGECSIKQTEYGIRPVSIAGGSLKLKDQVTLRFDILAHRRKEGG